MRKTLEIILLISLFTNIILGILFLRPTGRIEPVIEKYIHEIDSLEKDIDSLEHNRDSIRLEIDTVYVQIEKNVVKYEKTRNDILSFTPSEDYDYFTSYLERNRARLSTNNDNTVKGD